MSDGSEAQAGRLHRLAGLNTSRTTTAPRPRLKPRGLPTALEPHRIYRAEDPVSAARYGLDLLGPHRVLPTNDHPPDRDFAATFHGVLVRDVSIGYLDYSCGVTIDAGHLPDRHLIVVPATGASTISGSGFTIEATPVQAVMLHPGEAVELRCPADAAHMIVRIETDALETHLSRLLGRTLDRPLRFDPGFDLSAPEASRWNLAVQLLLAELMEPESLLHRGIGAGPIEEFVMGALLYGQRSTYTNALTLANQPSSAVVLAGVDHIERHLAEELTVEAVAEAAGVGVRALQKHFAADLGQSPTSYIRNRRLERARSDLADAAPNSGVTVTDVAARWGFTHLGRFSVTYRGRFGETPSHTLRH